VGQCSPPADFPIDPEATTSSANLLTSELAQACFIAMLTRDATVTDSYKKLSWDWFRALSTKVPNPTKTEEVGTVEAPSIALLERYGDTTNQPRVLLSGWLGDPTKKLPLARGIAGDS